MSAPTVVDSGDPSTATLVASYDALRRVALGHSGPDDRPSLGFTILLRHGMVTWLHAWAQCPLPQTREPRETPAIAIPSVVHTELAQVWAQMALAHREAAWM